MKGMAERWNKSIVNFDNQLEDYAENDRMG